MKVGVDLEERPAAAIEGIAYFTVSELLQNVSKHAGARGASVEVRRTSGTASGRLLIRVSDDGRGGADVTGGSGLGGLAERLRAVDGLFTVWEVVQKVSKHLGGGGAGVEVRRAPGTASGRLLIRV
ncbi:hypothetical protein ADK52_09690, partial [Streptomyces sp. WM6372]